MLGAILYGTRDVRCEEVPEPKILKPTDAIIRLSASCICGMRWHQGVDGAGARMRAAWLDDRLCRRATRRRVRWAATILLAEGPDGRTGSRAPLLMDLVLDRKINPGKVFDLELPLSDVAEGYRAMDERRAIKVLLRV